MIDKLIEMIKEGADGHVNGMCDIISIDYCGLHDCGECAFNEVNSKIILSELKELQEMKRHAEFVKKVLEDYDRQIN